MWIYTSWVTNWLDPEQTPVRILLFALMLGGLVLSTSIPKAFEERGLAFAVAYVFMQVGRTLFMLLATPAQRTLVRHNFQRILAWLAVSAVFWIAGGLAEGETRLVALDASRWPSNTFRAAARFWTPGLGRSSMEDWTVEGGHMAERCALFIIIALGESILVTGATFAELTWTPENDRRLPRRRFVGSIAMWWIYFHIGAEAGAEMHLASPTNPGRLARLAYTYLHMPIVAGIIVAAVGDELVLAHPAGHSDAKTVIGVVGGPLLFLVGTILFKHAIRGLCSFPWRRHRRARGAGLVRERSVTIWLSSSPPRS